MLHLAASRSRLLGQLVEAGLAVGRLGYRGIVAARGMLAQGLLMLLGLLTGLFAHFAFFRPVVIDRAGEQNGGRVARIHRVLVRLLG